MQNITKMRIVHSAEFNAEKEYLKTFFDYIGLLVYDEKILDFRYNDVWYKHLKINNEPDGVDIILNYYTDDFVPQHPYNKRIYLYFDLEQKICDITIEPVPNPYYLANYKNAATPKIDLRSEVLELLIDNIWQEDIKNKDAIKLIKECYISKNQNSDLFYILQAIYSYIDISDSYIIREHNAHMEEIGDNRSIIETNLFLDNYVEKFFSELWRVQCLVHNNESPYAIYTKINNSLLLLILYSNLSEYEKLNFPYTSYNGRALNIKSYNDIYEQIYQFTSNYSWFIKAVFMRMEMSMKKQHIYDYLLYCISESSFPAYYAPVYNIFGCKYFEENRNYEETIEMFNKTLEIDPNNYTANFRKGILETCEGKLKSGEEYFRNILLNLGTSNLYSQKNTDCHLFSLSEILKSFQSDIMLSKIDINSNKEYSARAHINEALLYAEYYENIPLIKRIADNDEKPYQDFILYHEYSLPVQTLYSYLKPWINDIIYDSTSKSILQKRLSKWK